VFKCSSVEKIFSCDKNEVPKNKYLIPILTGIKQICVVLGVYNLFPKNCNHIIRSKEKIHIGYVEETFLQEIKIWSGAVAINDNDYLIKT